MSQTASTEVKITVATYLDNGVVFEYDVSSPESAREHAAAIVAGGYRHTSGGALTHFPPWRILKVKCSPGIETSFPDRVRGT